MPIAETASNFNETLIMNAAINEAKGNEYVIFIPGFYLSQKYLRREGNLFYFQMI